MASEDELWQLVATRREEGPAELSAVATEPGDQSRQELLAVHCAFLRAAARADRRRGPGTQSAIPRVD
jgi:hypothetical protein